MNYSQHYISHYISSVPTKHSETVRKIIYVLAISATLVTAAIVGAILPSPAHAQEIGLVSGNSADATIIVTSSETAIGPIDADISSNLSNLLIPPNQPPASNPNMPIQISMLSRPYIK